MSGAPSIRARLGRALLVGSVIGSAAVALAVWSQADHEVDELLDETLEASAQVLAPLLAASAPPADIASNGATSEQHFAWQVVERDGRLAARSSAAPPNAWHAVAQPGFSDDERWRIHGRALNAQGRMLYVAQERAERREARVEVALSAVLAALAVGLLGHLWLRSRVGRELQPLQRLSGRLEGSAAPKSLRIVLGDAERSELQPVHDAIDALSARLGRRIAHERAFAGHAAHALRTPLAGIDAQLAVALREAPAQLQPRLTRVREGAARLQRVVSALLALFRSAEQVQRAPVALPSLMAPLPCPAGLRLDVPAGLVVHADADLLAAALINLLDNAARAGAHHVRLTAPHAQTLRIQDDGPGMEPTRRALLERALRHEVDLGPGGAADEKQGSAEDGPGSSPVRVGLGLRLAALVARAHGGSLTLPPVDAGFAVELGLGPAEG